MGRSDIQIKLDLISKDAERDIKNLNKAIEGTETGIEEMESAGKIAARALSAAADAIESDLKGTKAAAEALAQAMGPELSAKADMTSIITDLKNMGLTTDQITTDAGELAAALQKLETVGKGHVSGVKSAFDDVEIAAKNVGTTTDNTRSVVANFAGNAVQELPGVSAAMGPLNMAIGQFAEYATEGNIGFKNFIKAGLGLGAAGAALAAVSCVMGKIGDAAEKAKERQEGLNRAVEKFREGKTEDAANEIVEAYGDIIRRANDVGFTTSEVVQTIIGNYDLQSAAARKMATEELRALDGMLLGYTEYGTEVGNVADAVRKASGDWKNQNGTLDENADMVKSVTKELGPAKKATEDLGDEADDTADDVDKLTEAWSELKGELDLASEKLDAEQAFTDIKDAYAEMVTGIESGSLTAEQATRDYNQSLLDAKSTIAGYVEDIGGIPPDKLTNIYALLDQGKVDEAMAAFAILTAPRYADIYVNAKVGSGGDLLSSSLGIGAKRATGGIGHGMTLVGEQGPELVDLGQTGVEVLSAGRTQQALRTGGAPTIVQYNTINAARMSGREIADALDQLARREGRR